MALLRVVTVLLLFAQVIADSNKDPNPHTYYGSIVDEQDSMELVRQDPGERPYYVSKQFQATYYRQGCLFTGYKPYGLIRSVDQMRPPVVMRRAKETVEGVVKAWGRKMSKVVGIVMHVTKLSASLTKAAPALAPVLGIISGVMGLISEDDPLKEIRAVYSEVQRAFKEYTEELNKRLKQMEGYVDAKILDNNFKRERNHYRAFWKQWANCVKEPTEKLSVKCQMDEIKKIIARDHWFMKNYDCFENGKATCKITFEKVRQLEVYILLFRDYVNLVVMEYIPLIEYFCWTNKKAEHAAHNCRRFTQELQDKVKKYIDYAEGAVSYIKKAHKGKEGVGYCRETFTCETPRVRQMWSFLKRYPTASSKCKCRIGFWESKKDTWDSWCSTTGGRMWNHRPFCRCHIAGGFLSLRSCDDCNTFNFDAGNGKDRFQKAFNAYGLSVLLPVAKRRQKVSNAVVEKFYKQEIYDFTTIWRAAIELASCMQNNSQTAPSYELVAKKAECNGAEQFNWDIPSIAACAETCSGKASMFAYGTNEYGNNRCSSKGCTCYCETHSNNGVCAGKQLQHSGFNLYRIIKRKSVAIRIPLANATQSSTMVQFGCAGRGTCAADKAIDGDVKTTAVTYRTEPSWWSAQLEDRAAVTEVILTTGKYPFGQGYFNRLQVEVGDSAGGPWTPCKKEFKMEKPIVNHVVKCEQAKAANFVRIAIYGGVNLYLQEVKVMGEISGLCPGVAAVAKLGKA